MTRFLMTQVIIDVRGLPIAKRGGRNTEDETGPVSSL
jgi:hypothetical protein